LFSARIPASSPTNSIASAPSSGKSRIALDRRAQYLRGLVAVRDMTGPHGAIAVALLAALATIKFFA
jgi:hypothetical protein